MKNIVIICSVRKGTPPYVYEHVAKLELEGYKVHFPPRDNPQDSVTGYEICDAMLKAITKGDEIHVFYDPNSQGCHFDLGIAFTLKKNIKIMNPEIDTSGTKSYVKVFTRQ